MTFWLGVVAMAAALLAGISLLFGAPYVPSRRKDIEVALSKLYKVSKQDTLVDIGSGDGAVLRVAAKRGARAVGYEVNPLLALVSGWRKPEGVAVKCRNGLTADWPSNTTVVYVFGVERVMPKLERKVQAHVRRYGKAVRVISYGFKLPGLKPVREMGAYLLYEI
ncbi:MAG: hypothetical protein LBL84_03040 [Candidatus Nomurabacteria bacterium]|nr:hypothetical protein [Candidatus Nomurabacteria bacterium]